MYVCVHFAHVAVPVYQRPITYVCVCVYVCVCLSVRGLLTCVCACVCVCVCVCFVCVRFVHVAATVYGVASMSRLLEITGLFCKRAL